MVVVQAVTESIHKGLSWRVFRFKVPDSVLARWEFLVQAAIIACAATMVSSAAASQHAAHIKNEANTMRVCQRVQDLQAILDVTVTLQVQYYVLARIAAHDI